MSTGQRFRFAYVGLGVLAACSLAALVVVLLPERGSEPAQARPLPLDVRATAVVTAFLDASVRGDTEAACKAFPDYMPCAKGDDVPRPERYELGSVSLVDREHPVVFADIDEVRGFFVLEWRGDELVIVSANAD